jgi:chromosome segregation ATPase
VLLRENLRLTGWYRVEGRGAATIHDVTLSMVNKDVPKSSPRLEELLDTRESTANALTRCEEALSSLKQYLGSLTVQNLAVSQLESVLEQYESTGARLDAKRTEIKRELQRIDAGIAAERAQIAVPPEQNKLRNKAAIGVFAQTAGNVEIALLYGAHCDSRISAHG